jgi:hypothetical protein
MIARSISMKIISILSRLSTASGKKPARPAGDVPDWIRDPLAHPDLEAMSERELGDLPFRSVASPARSLDCVRG